MALLIAYLNRLVVIGILYLAGDLPGSELDHLDVVMISSHPLGRMCLTASSSQPGSSCHGVFG